MSRGVCLSSDNYIHKYVGLCVCLKEMLFEHRFYIMLLAVSLFLLDVKLKKEVVYSEKEVGASGSLAVQGVVISV